MSRHSTPVVFLLLVALLAPATLPAQRDLARADSLLRAGRVSRAEAVYFAAARQRPRDPAARLALGRYLAARGATRVGAVLIEEAWRFGAAPGVAATHLAPLYARLADWQALARLDRAPLSAGERARAAWLADNRSESTGPDSVALPLLPGRDGPAEVLIAVGADTIRAQVVPRAVGLVLDGSMAAAAGVRVFTGGATDSRQGAAVAREVRVGSLMLRNEPVRLEPLGAGRAQVGLELLARYAATVDPVARTLTLRRSGRVARGGGTRVPLLREGRDAQVAWNGRLEPLGGVTLAGYLSRGRWTVDARRGELVLE
ncbi:MAG TPA: hypothetical protein VGD77_12205 [Gemmatimonadaceae bacterium]